MQRKVASWQPHQQAWLTGTGVNPLCNTPPAGSGDFLRTGFSGERGSPGPDSPLFGREPEALPE